MLDTLSYSESLVSAGVPEEQAKLQAQALFKAFKSTDLVTTVDLKRLEINFVELMGDFEEIKIDIQQIRSDQRGIIIVALSIFTLLFALIYLTF